MPISPMPWPRCASAGSKPTPSSSTTSTSDPSPSLEQHVDAAGVRVLDDVVQRFLRDAVEGDLGFARHLRLPRHLDARNSAATHHECVRPLAHEARQRRGQAEIVEHGGPQLPGEKVELVVDLLGERQRARPGPSRGARGRAVPLERQPQRGQLLAELIVQVARDPRPLVLPAR